MNYWAVLVSAVVYHVLGAIWYGPVFGKPWMKLVGLTPESIKTTSKKEMILAYSSGFIAGLFVSFGSALLIQKTNVQTVTDILSLAGLLAAGFVGATALPSYMFLKKPFKLYLIDVGYHMVGTFGACLILYFWR